MKVDNRISCLQIGVIIHLLKVTIPALLLNLQAFYRCTRTIGCVLLAERKPGRCRGKGNVSAGSTRRRPVPTTTSMPRGGELALGTMECQVEAPPAERRPGVTRATR